LFFLLFHPNPYFAAMKVLTLTLNPALDKSTSIEHLAPEHKLRCEPPKYEPGGGGINVARVLRRFGTEALALYQSGGPAGQIIQELLEQEKVPAQGVPTTTWTRENLMVSDRSNTLQYRFVMPGPTLTPIEYQQFLDAISNLPVKPDFVVASGSLPAGVPNDFYGSVTKLCNDLDIGTVLDTSGTALKAALGTGVELIKPNLKELANLFGKEEISAEQEEDLAMELVRSGQSELVAVSLGARGAMLASADGVIYGMPPSVKVLTTVGAGDSMVAGMVYALCQKMNLEEVLRYGVACGTAATIKPGTGLADPNDVERLRKLVRVFS
jgi:6-phosphofructokinase 2